MIGEKKLKELVIAALVLGAQRGSDRHLSFNEAKAKIETSIEPMTERFTDALISGEVRVPSLKEANLMHQFEQLNRR
jgi:hypothetical protein